MDFSWSEEQLEIREAVAGLARERLRDDLIRRDQDSEFSRTLWTLCAEMGIETWLLLALPREAYMKASVNDGGPAWVDRACVPNGEYAVIVVHDANDNRKLDNGFLGFGAERFAEVYLVLADPDFPTQSAARMAEILRKDVKELCEQRDR